MYATSALNPVRRTRVRTEGSCSGRDLISDVSFLTVAEVTTIMRVSKMTAHRTLHAGD